LKKKAHSYIFLLLATLLLAAFVIWNGRVVHIPLPVKHKHEKEETVHSDTITALIFYHAADYFVYHGSVIGYQYDLLKQLGKDLNRPVEITVESDPSQAFIEAFSNKYDIIGFDFNKEMFTPEYIIESEPHSYTYPVLIMRKDCELDSTRNHVVHASVKYSNRVDFSILGNPKKWKLQHNFDASVEDLFEMLEDTLIDYVVCNYNVAITMLPFYKHLVLGPRIGENFPRTWVLNRNNGALNDTINQWLRDFKTTKQYEKLCTRYLSRHSQIIQNSFGKKRNSISSYDKVMQNACAKYGLDWKFMSSIVYQESHFTSDVLGMGGSFGIMQMMPATCERYGITDTSTVEEQLYAGARYIHFLHNIFNNKVDSTQIYYFVAGSYNSGPGHILDAMALCKKYGGDATKWDEVAHYLILKSHRDYYSDPVVKCGHYPGKHTVNYVDEVMTRYLGYVLTKKEQ
jgi:membrane-bound lytic murein transglycosylase F